NLPRTSSSGPSGGRAAARDQPGRRAGPGRGRGRPPGPPEQGSAWWDRWDGSQGMDLLAAGGGRAAGTELGHQLPEAVPALLEVGKLIKAGTGRVEQDPLAGAGEPPGQGHRRLQILRPAERR